MKINPTKLCFAMAAAQLTIRDLKILGKLSPSTISKAKNDPNYQPNLKTIGKIANALDVSVEYLTSD